MNRREQLRTLAMAEIHKSAVFEESTIQKAVDIVLNAIYPDVEDLLAFQSEATIKILELEDRLNGIMQQVPLTQYRPAGTPSEPGTTQSTDARKGRKSNLSLVTPPNEQQTTASANKTRKAGKPRTSKGKAKEGQPASKSKRRDFGPITEVRITHVYVPDNVWKEVHRISHKACDTPEELETVQQFFYHLFAGFEARVGLNYHATIGSAAYFFPILQPMIYNNSGNVKQFWHGYEEFKNGYEEFLKHNRTYGKNLHLPVVTMDSNTKRPKATVKDAQNVTVTSKSGKSKTVPVNPTQTSTIPGSVVGGGNPGNPGSTKDNLPWDEQPSSGGQKNEKKEVVHA